MFTSTTDAYKGNRNATIVRHAGDFQRTIMPWAAAVLAGGLAGITSWGQAQSKDLLPRYVMTPAIVGAICCALYGIACVVCFFVLQKYDNYHERKSNVPASQLKAAHPIGHWPRMLLLGVGMAACVTEGSYIYMLWFIVSDSENDFCVTWSPAKSKAQCDTGWSFALVYTIALGALISAGASYESVVQEAVDYFDNRKAMHGAGRLNSQQGGGGGGQGGGQGYGDDGYDDSQSMMGGGGGRRGYGADSYA